MRGVNGLDGCSGRAHPASREYSRQREQQVQSPVWKSAQHVGGTGERSNERGRESEGRGSWELRAEVGGWGCWEDSGLIPE